MVFIAPLPILLVTLLRVFCYLLFSFWTRNTIQHAYISFCKTPSLYRLAFLSLGTAVFLKGASASFPAIAQSSSTQCHVESFGDLKVMNDDNSPIIQTFINNQPVYLEFDTGAFMSSIDKDMAEKLGLETSYDYNIYAKVNLQDVSGTTRVEDLVVAKNFRLGLEKVRIYFFQP